MSLYEFVWGEGGGREKRREGRRERDGRKTKRKKGRHIDEMERERERDGRKQKEGKREAEE